MNTNEYLNTETVSMHIAEPSAINDHFQIKAMLNSRRIVFILITNRSTLVSSRSHTSLHLSGFVNQVKLTFHQVMQLSLLKHWIEFICIQANMPTHNQANLYLANRALQQTCWHLAWEPDKNSLHNIIFYFFPSSQAFVFTNTTSKCCLFSFANP